uniref:INTEGRASE n=1 Tax=Rous sarcoma virus (strain Schmidt-Ruppin) TaxID=11889 RepID=UPI0000112ED6|nr:Chain A, Integrase [Rous sarcoma virus (strain Schmidt-Ruppin)]1VSF_A Chain A, Integrase [Rous sarcoma virus (strain Schmidt-Ruppin)]
PLREGLGPLQIWQTDFTLEPRMAPRSWLAVTVDTASSAIVVTQHGRVTSVAAQHHWATAIAVLGRPKAIKTDNGSCFTSKSTREWLARWGIAHTTGIPGNSQGQAMVERANRLLKDKIRVLAEGDGFMKRIPTSKQGELLAKAMYALNHFNL